MRPFLIILLLYSQLTFSQDKSYSGSFNTTNFKGNASYKYKENIDGQRSFDGAFSFKSQDSKFSITGDFQDNKRNGQWKIILNNVNYSNLVGNYIISSTTSGSYNEGKLSGAWNIARTTTMTISNNSLMKSLTFLFADKNYKPNEAKITKETFQASFKDNHFVNVFKYSSDNGKIKVSGKFNNEGFCDSTWQISFYEDGILKNEINEYKNGVLTSRKNIDNSTGDIKVIYAPKVNTNDFFKNYNPDKNISIVNGSCYNLKNGNVEEGNNLKNYAISAWTSNKLPNTSMISELERGASEIQYSDRIIVFDYDATEEYKSNLLAEEERLEQQKEKEEKEKIAAQKLKEQEEEQKRYKAKQKAELEAFMVERNTNVYQLNEFDPNAYNSHFKKISKDILNKIEEDLYDDYAFDGVFIINVDTNGTITRTIKESNNIKLKKEIGEILNSFELPTQQIRGYKVNCQAQFNLKILSKKGKSKCLSKASSSPPYKTWEFTDNDLSNDMKKDIMQRFSTEVYFGKYSLFYNYVNVNDEIYIRYNEVKRLN